MAVTHAIDEQRQEIILREIRRAFPDWQGCADERFVAEEITYKRNAVRKAAELLSEAQLRGLADKRDYEEIRRRLEQVAHSTNLLYMAMPKQGDLNVLYVDDLNLPAFCDQVIELFHAQSPTVERLHKYLSYVGSNNLPNKWTFPTYFLFLLHPDEELFIKPAVTKRFLNTLGLAELWEREPSAEGYRRIRSLAQELLGALRPYGAVDMVDVQSVLWAVGQQHTARGYKTLKHVEQFEELYARFVTEYARTDEGEEHRKLILTSRDTAKRNFDELATEVTAGRDVGDDILVRLLPHGHQGMVAGHEWIRPDEWPQVAAALFSLLRKAVETPEKLGDACTEFVATVPGKGLQAGIISPILNALRPHEYRVVNSKSLGLLRHFTDKKYTSAITSYADANVAIQKLETSFNEILEESRLQGLLPGDMLDMFAYWCANTGFLEGDETGIRYWKIAPGENARLWDLWQREGIISVGWDQLGEVIQSDLAQFMEHANHIAAREGWGKGVRQVWTFARQIRLGDRIIANKGTKQIVGVGTVTGPYYFQEDKEHCHRIPVRWDDVSVRAIDEGGFKKTLVALDEEKFKSLVGQSPPPPAPEYPLAEVSKATYLDEDRLRRWVSSIDRKGQAVFYGPPGTGKTFVAEHLARHLIGGGDGFMELVQFHPAYGYEDFIQGIRPRVNEQGALDYEMVSGRFIEFCDRARARRSRCVLIIDEINRANLARVFGELMYLLEYREQEVPLAGGNILSIPPNVRIIGTMNTADRSIALVDHALRRRFAFIKLAPELEILSHFHGNETPVDIHGLQNVIRDINSQIADEHYSLGISFFLQPDLHTCIEDIWRMELEPYLEEYFFDQPSAVNDFRWERVRARVLRG
jgi:hypothetical protein